MNTETQIDQNVNTCNSAPPISIEIGEADVKFCVENVNNLLHKSYISYTKFRPVNVSGDPKKDIVKNYIFDACNINGTNFNHSKISKCTFRGKSEVFLLKVIDTDFTHCFFIKCKFINILFIDCDMYQTVFDTCVFINCEFKETRYGKSEPIFINCIYALDV